MEELNKLITNKRKENSKMGLDMYLTKITYLSDNHNLRNGAAEITLDGDKEPIKININRIRSIHEHVMYWRKANHIHNWFVENVQDGVDECQQSYVSTDQLGELLDSCEKVMEDKSLAEELLPTQSGFFFGETDYDEDYFNHIKETADVIKEILKEDNRIGRFYYQSSW